MTKLIIDSNIVFSAILNTQSQIAQILITVGDFYEFYAPQYLRTEIINHKSKIKKIAQLNDDEFFEIYELVLKNVTFLNHVLVDQSIYQKAFDICQDIDIDDTPFVAFSIFLDCRLWTGDKKLITGLKKNKFNNVVNTETLFNEFLKHINN